MSLVLEALRRQQADTDSSAAVTLALQAEQQRSQRTWIAVLAVALLLNAAVFAWLFRETLFGIDVAEPPVAAEPNAAVDPGAVAQTPGTTPGTTPASVSTTAGGAPTDPATTAAAPAGALPADAATAGSTQSRVEGAIDPATGLPAGAATNVGAFTPSVASAPEPPPRVLERVDLDSLPPGPRGRFPGIAFSTHVYAEDPALRAIVVNGDRMQEGDRIGDLLIQEITEQGVVFEFESYLVEVPVFTDW